MELSGETWKSIEYVETAGLVIRRGAIEQKYAKPEHIPFTLHPSKLNRKTFYHITELQKVINRLVHRASRDEKFIEESLQRMVFI